MPLAVHRTSEAGAAPAGLPATAAERFVESVGVNTHFNYPGTPYTERMPAVVAALVASGIRHVRDGMPNYSRPQVLADLGRHGISHSLGFAPDVSAEQISAALRADAPFVDHVEPENELDLNRSHPDWVPEWRAEQRLIAATVHGSSASAGVTVVGPAVGHFSNAAALGPIDRDEDAGAMHYYPCDEPPGETGSPLSLAALTQIVRSVHVTKPIWTTEVGYEDDLPARCALPDDVIAKYAPRMIAEHWLAGQPRTYFYQFADMGSRRGYDAMGFVDIDGKPKPQYRALASMLTLLADPGPAFAPAPFVGTISGDDSAVHRLVLQKRDKTFIVLLWLEVAGWDSGGRATIAVPPRTVELHFDTKPADVGRYAYARDWSLQKTALARAKTVNVSVTDAIGFLTVRFAATQSAGRSSRARPAAR